MSRLKIWHKLTLVIAAFSLMVAAMLVSFVAEKQREVGLVRQARDGAAYLVPARRVLETLPQYEEQMNEKGEADAAARNIEEALRALEAAEEKYGAELQTKDHLAALQSKWQALKGQGPDSAPLERQKLLADALAATRQLITQTGLSSQLALSENLASYYTTDVVWRVLPEQQEALAHLWQLSFSAASRQDVTPETQARMLMLAGQVRDRDRAAEASLRVALEHSSANTLQSLSFSSRESSARAATFLNLLDNWLVKNSGAAINPAELNAAGRQALTASFRFWDTVQPVLDVQLQTRAERARRDFYLWLLVGCGGWLLLLLLAWRLVKGVSRSMREALALARTLAQGRLPEHAPATGTGEPGALLKSLDALRKRLQRLSKTAQTLAWGDLSAAVEPQSPDDAVGHAFQKMHAYLQEQARAAELLAAGLPLDSFRPKSGRDRLGKAAVATAERLQKLAQTEKENLLTQHSILQLLEGVSEAATGDLRVEAEVKNDPTGALADAFNLMIGKLRQIIYKVKETTFQVNQSAVHIQLATDELAAGSEFQAAQLNSTARAIRAVTDSIHEVSTNAAQSALVARRSLETSRDGTRALKNNLEAMKRIRDQVQETTTRIQRLGERSEEIAASLQLIRDIASRTSMLALNAAIQAGLAGEGGRGFVIVAEEIEGLAERTANVAKQITTLARAMRTETKEVVAAMEATTHEVSSGSVRANEAERALDEIQEVSSQMALLIQAIWQATQKQTHGSEEIAKFMREISNVTQRVAAGSQQAAASVRQLVGQAEALGNSVVAFRLPEKTVTLTVTTLPDAETPTELHAPEETELAVLAG
jgi:twitching motility protein PilJ